jgi:hypothetical protein
MKLVPRVLLISLAALGMTGCRAYGPSPSPRLLPPPEPRTAFDVSEFVSEHNRNAKLVESLEARPRITASKVGRLRGTPLTGVMVMERPRNFKLELRADTAMRRAVVADIGSNDSEFWFMNSEDKSIYACKFEELPSTPLAVSFQPDWIIDALGLKTISPEVARAIKARPGKEAQTTELVFPPTRSNGQISTRVLTVSDKSRQILTHRLYGGDNNTLLAQADISAYQEVSLDDQESEDSQTAATCLLPQKIKLDWKKEEFILDVNLNDVVLNNFDPKQRDAVFVEPVIEHYARVNLAKPRAARQPRGDTTIRESLPAPESKVRLKEPVDDPDDSAFTTDSVGFSTFQGRSRSTLQLDDESETTPLEEPLRARVPRPPNTYDYQLADTMRSDAPPPAIGRLR